MGRKSQLGWQRSRRESARDITAEFRHGFFKHSKRRGCPKPKDGRRRALGKRDIAFFCSHYFPDLFYRPMTPGQLEDLKTGQRTIRRGGKFAFAAPRGDGKTARVVALTLYAVLYGFRAFVVIVGADLSAARDEILAAVKTHLRTNERLREDFPEACIPALLSDDVAQRASQQSLHHRHLRFKWSKDEIRLPTIRGSESSGAIVLARGLTGRLRGMFRTLEDGAHVRPDLFLPDDPQTDESAKSPSQCDDRERLLLGAVLGAAGEKPPAVFLPCTIIEPGDLAARFLNSDRHPDWQGKTRSMIRKWPKAQDTLWKEYMNIRRGAQKAGDNEATEATAFYEKNRKAMDQGADVDDPNRIHDTIGALSALQNAENLLCDRGEEVFFAEYQNEPKPRQRPIVEITEEMVMSRTNGLAPRTAPEGAAFVTGHVDVNLYGLHWVLAGVTNNMTGYVLDYGRFPADGRRIVPVGTNKSEAVSMVYAALESLTTALGKVEIARPTGPGGIDLLLLDCGYMTDTVFDFARHARNALPYRVRPCRGQGAKHFRTPAPARLVGESRDHCYETTWTGKGNVIVHHSDYWREATQSAFRSTPGGPGSLSLYGNTPADHGDYARQIVAEYLVEHVVTDVREYWTWAHVPGSIWDLLDATVGALVGACMLGASFGGVASAPTRKRKKKRRRAKVKRED